jgi:vacuolar-type H+-ATPase subunit I/STV1
MFDEICDSLKDIATSLTRIGTDTVIDLANVVTGFYFNDEVENAKKEMSNAGILNATDSIEKHYYSFLKDLEVEAEKKYQEILDCNKKGMQLETQLNAKRNFQNQMIDDLEFLMQISLEAEQKFEKLKVIPKWERVMENFGVNPNVLKKINKYSYTSKWIKVAESLQIAMLGVNTIDGITGITAISSSLIQIRKFKNAKNLGQVGVELQASSRLSKIGRAASKASIVLTVASIGLDIGLSVVELEERKNKLEHYLTQLNDEIAKINQDIKKSQQELKDIESLITKLLLDVDPHLTIESWTDWVETNRKELVYLQERLISFESIIERATKIAKATNGESYKLRIQLIQNLDSKISEEVARAIISAANK